MQNKEQSTVKPKSRFNFSNIDWVIIGFTACILGFICARVWVTYGGCIPCWFENVWNGLQTWIHTGYFPFW